MGVDFRVAEAVDSVQLIYGIVPKKLLQAKPGILDEQITPPL
jgi:hypothetical protein